MSVEQAHTDLLNRLEDVGVIITTDVYQATRQALANVSKEN